MTVVPKGPRDGPRPPERTLEQPRTLDDQHLAVSVIQRFERQRGTVEMELRYSDDGELLRYLAELVELSRPLDRRQRAIDAAEARANELIAYWDLSTAGHDLEPDQRYEPVVREIVDAALGALEVSS